MIVVLYHNQKQFKILINLTNKTMKNFLRPTKFKIILAVIFFLILFFIPIIPGVYRAMPDILGTTEDNWGLWSLTRLYVMGFSPEFFGLNMLGNLSAYLYIIVISYALSSFTFYLFKKDEKIAPK